MIYLISLNTQAERQAVIRLQKASYAVEAALINCYDIPGLKDTEDSLLASEETFWGYKIDNTLVGMVSYKVIGMTLDIHRVVVDPRYFNRKVASTLISYIEAYTPNIDKIIVSTGKDNYPACKLYEKLGYLNTKEVEVAPGLIICQFEKQVK